MNEAELGFELKNALTRIEQMEERMRGADALIVLWETRATRAEARVEALEKHKRSQMEDVMNLGAQLGQARLRIEQLEAALLLAEDVLSRFPFSTAMWPNGMHPQIGIDIIRTALNKKRASA